MREKLKPLLGVKEIFCATFFSFHDFQIGDQIQKRVLLKNLMLAETNEFLADHVWVGNANAFSNYKKGDLIYFQATVSKYHKGGGVNGLERTIDYGFKKIQKEIYQNSILKKNHPTTLKM